MAMQGASGWEPRDNQTETWQCGHCSLQVAIPDEQTNHDGYIDTIVLIREHRFGHIAEAFMKGTDEAIMGLVDDDPHSLLNGGPVIPCKDDDQPDWVGWLSGHRASPFHPNPHPVTKDDVIPALAEADRLVRGGRP